MVDSKPMEYAKIMALLVGGIFAIILIINTLAPDFFISIGQVMFMGLMILGIYIITRLFHLEQTGKVDLESLVIYGAVIVGIIALLWYFPNIAPQASVQANNLMSLVRLG